MSRITIYTTTNCPFCKMLKGYLDEKGMAYTEVNVETNSEKQEEMIALSGGFAGTPFSIITNEDGSVVKVTGFDKKKIDEALGLSQ